MFVCKVKEKANIFVSMTLKISPPNSYAIFLGMLSYKSCVSWDIALLCNKKSL